MHLSNNIRLLTSFDILSFVDVAMMILFLMHKIDGEKAIPPVKKFIAQELESAKGSL